MASYRKLQQWCQQSGADITGAVRQLGEQEAKATTVLALSLDECSCKVSDKMPEDDPADLVDEVYSGIWAGVVPMREVFDAPLADPQATSRGAAVPGYVTTWRR